MVMNRFFSFEKVNLVCALLSGNRIWDLNFTVLQKKFDLFYYCYFYRSSSSSSYIIINIIILF